MDPADVPLQWLVLPVGGDCGRRTHVTMRKVDPGRVWHLIDHEGVTHYCGAPTVQLMIVDHPSAHRVERR